MKKTVKEDYLKKHISEPNIGVINAGLRPILHNYREGKISLMVALDKIHAEFNISEVEPRV